MKQYPSIPMAIVGLLIAACVGATLIAPCGPGSSWPLPLVTGVYGTTLCLLPRKAIRIFALIVIIGSLVFLGSELHARSKEKARQTLRIEELAERQITEPSPGAYSSKAADGLTGNAQE